MGMPRYRRTPRQGSGGLQTLLARQGDDLAVSRHAQVRQLTSPCAGGGRRAPLAVYTCPGIGEPPARGAAASRPSWRGKETTWQFPDMPRSGSSPPHGMAEVGEQSTVGSL